MKKIIFTLVLLFTVVANSFALTLREAYDEIGKLPDLKGVETGHSYDLFGGWLGSIPLENASIVYKVHEVGDAQTVFYGGKVEEIARQIPKSDLILSGSDYSNLICFFAKPVDRHNAELLILIDMAYQGKTVAIYGKVNSQIIHALKNGKITFTSDHKIVVSAPLLVAD